ncbi:MAG: bifunctional glutamate N-acetyltransferase/amino-acid acetyltransferase ArgJ [Armatimonadota bacterium]
MKFDWIDGAVTAPKGFSACGVRCGLKQAGPDLALIYSERADTTVAGVFTQNQACAASVRFSQLVVEGGKAQAIVANSGNANALTGEQGFVANAAMAQRAAELLGISPRAVITASTGVTGQLLPLEKIQAGLDLAVPELSADGGPDAAEAIRTTDTYAKREAIVMHLPEGDVRLGAICKGSGMIAPNMATMLCFITTDAIITASRLQQCLRDAVERSFNCVTVDADTSTNDMLVVLANGASGVDVNRYMNEFQLALEALCVKLARQMAADGEGATKLVEIVVQGARTYSEARVVGKTIGESMLVKTALFGNDPNWGRILAAAGRSGVELDIDRVAISMAGTPVCANGQPVPFDAPAVSNAMKAKELPIVVELGLGTESCTIWTCDLSYEYVRINAEYHT